MQRELGFHIPQESDTTLTGHIDVLQIRNGRVHILDYKPGDAKEKPITQLMVYALALSRRTGLRLYDFVCAWFDEHHDYRVNRTNGVYAMHGICTDCTSTPYEAPFP